jgi:2-oxoglutarate/2-oxoacid ferredoxin oxidoreductase subunit alpha
VPKEVNIRIAGEAGQGIETIGLVLCRLIKKCGLNIFAHQDYMSRIRGGNNYFQVRIAGQPVYAPRGSCEIIVALDKSSVSLYGKDLAARGIMLLDKQQLKITDQAPSFLDIAFFSMARDIGGSELYVNSAALGVIAGLLRLDLSLVAEVLRESFTKKGEEIIAKNIAVAKAGYEAAKTGYKEETFALVPGKSGGEILLNGNEALALGAVRGGCKFYSGYPMTPSTAIMNSMAHYSRDYNIVVEQAEDEIAAINMVIGASYAGVRSMTATSGGGFALMVEGLSLAGMLETPIVVVDGQRPAPATGFPTRTEQGDLDFLIHAGHGEFARVIFAPGTAEEAFYLTVKAFNLAEKYQIPVLIMTDTYLADTYRDINKFDLALARVKRYRLNKEESSKISSYRRYQLTASGVSPLAVPSWVNDVVYADSDEHTEDGHITEDAGLRYEMVGKRFYKKMAGLEQEIEPPITYNIDKAKTIMIGFGSTYGVIKEAAESLEEKNIGCIHLPQVWPFPAAAVDSLVKKADKLITVENNAGAQLAGVLRRATGIKADRSILKYDGRPFSLEGLLKQLQKEI